MFNTFDQNNSGGRFVANDNIGTYVIVEGTDLDDINNRAEDIGIYFGGGSDCPCCGDRWYPAYDGDEEPLVYGQSPAEYVGGGNPGAHWADPGRHVVVHYMDGRKEWF